MSNTAKIYLKQQKSSELCMTQVVIVPSEGVYNVTSVDMSGGKAKVDELRLRWSQCSSERLSTSHVVVRQ